MVKGCHRLSRGKHVANDRGGGPRAPQSDDGQRKISGDVKVSGINGVVTIQKEQ